VNGQNFNQMSGLIFLALELRPSRAFDWFDVLWVINDLHQVSTPF
jgi:hypothetical protein